MTLETLENIGHDFTTPRFTVEVGDTTLDETSGLITSVTVDRTIDGADHFSLSLAPRFDFEDGEFIDFSFDDLPIGEKTDIDIGYGSDLQQVLDGSITEHGIDFSANGSPSVTVSGYGRYHDLTHDIVAEQWVDCTDSEIAESIAAEYDLNVTVDETPITHETVEVEQDNDAAFLEEKLADRNDDGNGSYEVFARLDELVFRAPRDYREPEIELKYGESLQSFSPSYTEARTPGKVEVRHRDPKTNKDIVGVAESANGGTGKRVVRKPVTSEEMAEHIAMGILHRGENERLEGNAETVGLPEIEIGEPIKLTGLGDRFNGDYYVEEVTHTVDSSGYSTSFSVRLPLGVDVK